MLVIIKEHIAIQVKPQCIQVSPFLLFQTKIRRVIKMLSVEENDFSANPAHNYITFKPNLYVNQSVPLKKLGHGGCKPGFRVQISTQTCKPGL